MNKYLVIAIILFAATMAYGQSNNYTGLQVKEHFDHVYQYSYMDTYNMPWGDLISDGEEHNLGSVRAVSLEALLVMYETTGDKMYLYECMDKIMAIMNSRKDIAGTSSEPIWFDIRCVWTGRMLWPLSHFVYLVFSKPELCSELIFNPSLFNGHSTFGNFAQWLNNKLLQTYDYALAHDYQRDVENCADTDDKDPYDEGFAQACDLSKGTGALNFQAPYGCSFIYAYLCNPAKTEYREVAVVMAYSYFNKDYSEHKTNDPTWDDRFGENATNLPRSGILYYNLPTNAYFWGHNGWRKNGDCIDCNDFFDCNKWSKFFKEDIGHAQWDIAFPLLYNKYRHHFKDAITPDEWFENSELVRFRNTFVYHIYDSVVNKFHNAVDGTSSNVYAGDPDPSKDADYQKDFQYSAKGWMPLHQFDSYANDGESLYNIVMDYYLLEDQVLPPPGSYAPGKYEGYNIKGLADIAAAHWKKENFNLNMYNRDLNYNQDFSVKNILTIEPAVIPAFGGRPLEGSFADDKFIERKFIINPGIKCDMRAGTRIVLKPGFHAKAGSNFSARIIPSVSE